MTTSRNLDDTLQVTADVAEEHGYSYLAEFLRTVATTNWFCDEPTDEQFANALLSEKDKAARVAAGLSENAQQALHDALYENHHLLDFGSQYEMDDVVIEVYEPTYDDDDDLVVAICSSSCAQTRLREIEDHLSEEVIEELRSRFDDEE